jgi:putative Mg2+ transporter-C (MgtC) family protein
MGWQEQLQIIGLVALAMLLGGLIGAERRLADKPAGLRTHMLIAGAAALLTAIGGALLENIYLRQGEAVQSDPLRIIQAIITGISFIGAGTILRHNQRDKIEGLTTASSILFSAALGICVARQLYVLSVGVTVLTLLVLRVLGKLELRLMKLHDKDAEGGG